VRLAAVALLVLAAGVALHAGHRLTSRAIPALAASLALLVLTASPWDRGVMTSGVFRITVAKRFARAGRIPKADVVFYQDGIATTVSVERYGDRFAMKNNGKVEASSVGDMPTQVLVGLIPVLLHGGSEQKVAVVGYGSGITVGAIAESPDVAHIDVVELEPAVLRAADAWFGPFNHQVHENPKLRRWLGDGRNFLTAYPQKYDVIVSEPSNPWIAGVSSLFTREFYAFAKQHLAEDGVYCQWAQLYELGPRHVKSIYRTFQEAFPYVYAFSSADLSADTILVGSLRPLPLDLATLERLAAAAAARAELARGGVDSAVELVALLVMGPDEVPSFAAGAPINTDDNALLEFGAPRDLLAAGRAGARFADGIYAWGWPYGHLDGVISGLGDGAVRAGRELALARALLHKGKRREARAWLERARTSGADVAAVELLWQLAREREWSDPELSVDAGGPPIGPPDASWFDPELPREEREQAARRLAGLDRLLAQNKAGEALELIGSLPAPAPGDAGADLVVIKGAALYRLLDFSSARLAMQVRVDDQASITRRPALLYYYARVIYGDGDFEGGARLFEQFAARWPQLVPP
jgi:spermidine synthase